MVHLTLAGLSEDGKRLLLLSDTGAEFTLDVDTKLKAVLRGDSQIRASLGQLEIKMESILRPRDIQARIRAGETPEAVAAAAQTSLEKIMPYAAPVLAEREHVAQRAQRASIRRSAAAGGPPATAANRTLGDAVAGHLRAQNVDPGGVEWDAWRREDSRWTLTATYLAGSRSGEAAFTFDAPGNYVSADDDEARWLIGDTVAGPAPQRPVTAEDDLASARRRRLASVPGHELADELPLGEDAIDLVSDDRDVPVAPGALGAEAPMEAYLDEPDPMSRTSELDRVEPQDETDDEPGAEAEAHDEESVPPPARRKGRASVPSWDEIMFGGGKHD